ncbi:zinc ribbon domain-containing protein [Psychrobacillus sp. FJAT-51614]|uniref:Zinc ribbon domain-containing protein n=1 Tax=Psychrobacillus mangrovi TaxID=3117745 RepID=A0ABU8F3H6_9BACI
MFCKECGQQHDPNLNYCPRDGQNLHPELPFGVEHRASGFCASCGKSVVSDAQYCQHCGESHSTISFSKGGPKKNTSESFKKKSFATPSFSVAKFSSASVTPILLAVGISILLTLLGAFFIKSQVENSIIEYSGNEVTSDDIKNLNILTEELENESGIDLNLPNIYNIFTYVSLMHSVDFKLTGEVKSDIIDGEKLSESATLILQNLSLTFLPVVIFILLISGLILGFIAKKRNLSFSSSILGFGILYGIFLSISSFIANFTYKNGISIFFTDIDVLVKGRFPLIESFIVGFLLAISIAGIASMFMLYKRDVFAFIKTKASYIQYTIYSTVIMIIGTFLYTVVSFSILSKIEEVRDEYLHYLFTGPVGMIFWKMSHLIPINFVYKEYSQEESFSLHLFSSIAKFEESGFVNEFLEFSMENGIPFWLKASILIPAVFLIIAGYNLYQTHNIKVAELVKFSLIYAFIMSLISLLSNIKYSVEGKGSEIFDLGHTMFQVSSGVFGTFFISAIFAFIFITLGGYIKHYVGDSTK